MEAQSTVLDDTQSVSELGTEPARPRAPLGAESLPGNQKSLSEKIRSAVYGATFLAASIGISQNVHAQDFTPKPEPIPAPREVDKSAEELLARLKQADASVLDQEKWQKTFAKIKADPRLKKELADAMLPLFANESIEAEKSGGARKILEKLGPLPELYGQPAIDATRFVRAIRWGDLREPESYGRYINIFPEGCLKGQRKELEKVATCNLSQSLMEWLLGEGKTFDPLISQIAGGYGLSESQKDCINCMLMHGKSNLTSILQLLFHENLHADVRTYLVDQCAKQGMPIKEKKPFLHNIVDDPESPEAAIEMSLVQLLKWEGAPEDQVKLHLKATRLPSMQNEAVNFFRDYYTDNPDVSMRPLFEIAFGEISPDRREELFRAMSLTFGGRKVGPDNFEAADAIIRFLNEDKVQAAKVDKKSIREDEKRSNVRTRALNALGSASHSISKEAYKGPQTREKTIACFREELKSSTDSHCTLSTLVQLSRFGSEAKDAYPEVLAALKSNTMNHHVPKEAFDAVYHFEGVKGMRRLIEDGGHIYFATLIISRHYDDAEARKLNDEIADAKEGDPLYDKIGKESAVQLRNYANRKTR